MKIHRVPARAILGLLTVTGTLILGAATLVDPWSPAERNELESLWIGSLPPLPPDPTNRVADEPAAVALGHLLFFDTRLSRNGQVSCATCHLPEMEFQDGIPLGKGVGTTDRRTMPVAATARAPFLFWDGRKDSQWSQALGPLESPVEHGGTRVEHVRVVAEHYRGEYEALFGPLPDLDGLPNQAGPVDDPEAWNAWEGLPRARKDAVTSVFVNMGKAIAAYQRKIEFGASPFDRYVEALLEFGVAPEGVLSRDEVAGLRLFLGKGNCTQCHNGPLLTNNEFHNTGVLPVAGLPADRGRFQGALSVLGDEFNCRSPRSDGGPAACIELDVMPSGAPELERAFKVPSLRNVADRPPYMHAGQLPDLGAVLDHYNRAPAAPSGRSELEPLRLSRRELRRLEAFLRALSGGTDAPEELLGAPR
jgi:cytochrome c peroxidase